MNYGKTFDDHWSVEGSSEPKTTKKLPKDNCNSKCEGVQAIPMLAGPFYARITGFRRRVSWLESNSSVVLASHCLANQNLPDGNRASSELLVLDSVALVHINAISYINAFRLFETMNDRGLDSG